MAILEFPSVDLADSDGLLALGGDLEIESLKLAYSRGIFPWPLEPDVPLAWFSPNPRAVIFSRDFRIPTSFKKFLKKHSWTIRTNTHFEQVIFECSQLKNRGQDQTWITPDLMSAYIDFYKAGHAYSVEVFSGLELVGGLYGVNYRNCISAESMFYRQSNASKLALYFLLNRVKNTGIPFIDVQMLSPVVTSFGASYLSRNDFIVGIKELQKQDAIKLF